MIDTSDRLSCRINHANELHERLFRHDPHSTALILHGERRLGGNKRLVVDRCHVDGLPLRRIRQNACRLRRARAFQDRRLDRTRHRLRNRAYKASLKRRKRHNLRFERNRDGTAQLVMPERNGSIKRQLLPIRSRSFCYPRSFRLDGCRRNRHTRLVARTIDEWNQLTERFNLLDDLVQRDRRHKRPDIRRRRICVCAELCRNLSPAADIFHECLTVLQRIKHTLPRLRFTRLLYQITLNYPRLNRICHLLAAFDFYLLIVERAKFLLKSLHIHGTVAFQRGADFLFTLHNFSQSIHLYYPFLNTCS